LQTFSCSLSFVKLLFHVAGDVKYPPSKFNYTNQLLSLHIYLLSLKTTYMTVGQ